MGRCAKDGEEQTNNNKWMTRQAAGKMVEGWGE